MMIIINACRRCDARGGASRCGALQLLIAINFTPATTAQLHTRCNSLHFAKGAPHNVRCTPSALHSAINLKPCHTFQALLSHSTLQSTAHGVQGGLAHCAQLHQIAINFVHFFDLSNPLHCTEQGTRCTVQWIFISSTSHIQCVQMCILQFAELCTLQFFSVQSENCAELELCRVRTVQS